MTCGDGVVDNIEAHDAHGSSCSSDVQQLVLCLQAHVLYLADVLLYVRDLSFLSCLHALRCNLA
jgi:hypothetical protein